MATLLLILAVITSWRLVQFIRKFLQSKSNSTKEVIGEDASEYVEVVLPDMFQSFLRQAPKVNSHYSKVKLESEDWLSRFCSFDPEMQTKVNKCDFSLFCAIAAPFAPPAEFRSMCDWGNWVFPYDDMFDNGYLRDQPEKATEVMSSLMSLMEGRKADHPKLKIVEAHDTVVERIAAKSSLGVQKRFASAMRAYSLGVLEHVSDQDAEKAPTLEEMVITRRESAGATPIYHLVEYAHDLQIPDEVFEDPNIMELEMLGKDMVSISNDMLSYKKEEAEAVPHNMVAICRRNGMSAQKAFDAVGDLLDERFRRWEAVEKMVPSWGEKTDLEVQGYIYGIKSIVSANMNWSFKSQRYLGCDAADIRSTRKIRVLARPPFLIKTP